MSDKISEEERYLIDSYQGPINRIQRGRSAFSIHGNGHWKEGADRQKRIKDRVRKFELSKERDEKIIAMVKEGATISDIARATGLNRKSVKSRMERLKLT